MKIGITAGSFDVIHPGYVKMFNECKEHCDLLLVFLHEDPSSERPDKLKPILSIEERFEILTNLRSIDNIVPYKTELDLYKFLKEGVEVYNSDNNQATLIRFLGDDYIGKSFTGDDLNIPIHYLNRDHGWSTTKYKKLIADEVQRSSNI